MSDPALADSLNNLLLNHGISEHAALKPLDALERLLADRESADWRDAYMAALAGTGSTLFAEHAANDTVLCLAKRRSERLKATQS